MCSTLSEVGPELATAQTYTYVHANMALASSVSSLLFTTFRGKVGENMIACNAQHIGACKCQATSQTMRPQLHQNTEEKRIIATAIIHSNARRPITKRIAYLQQRWSGASARQWDSPGQQSLANPNTSPNLLRFALRRLPQCLFTLAKNVHVHPARGKLCCRKEIYPLLQHLEQHETFPLLVH